MNYIKYLFRRNKIKVGQTWKSKFDYGSSIGHYIIKVTKVYYVPLYGTLVDTEFTATEWKDGHWNTDTTNAVTILEGYELVETK
jgi:hypothetical protein